VGSRDTIVVSFRVARDLLGRVKREATSVGGRYQRS
jgi:predicted DNA binding CopG/RHH family protein